MGNNANVGLGNIVSAHSGFIGVNFYWPSDDVEPRTASEAVLAMDHRTQEALTIGHVELPRRSVHAGIWFRLLRTLLDELSIPLSHWGARAPDLRLAWASCGYPGRAGQALWRPYEAFPWPVQAQLLEATAGAVHLLETRSVTGRGAHAELFLPTPHLEVDDGRPPEEELNWWARLGAAVEVAVQLARDHPADAQTLFNFILMGCRTPEAVDRWRINFTELGIPTDNLSCNHCATPSRDVE